MFRSSYLTVAAALFAALAALAPATAFAQRDAGAKFRGEFGRRASSYRAYDWVPVFQAPAPRVVRRAPAAQPAPLQAQPPAVAQTPTQRRAFSYEPAPEAAPARQFRAYSYEPAPVYRAPAASRRSSPFGPQRAYERADSKFLGRVGR